MAEALRANHKWSVQLVVWTLEQFRQLVEQQIPEYFDPITAQETRNQLRQALDVMSAAAEFGRSWVKYDWGRERRRGLVYLQASPYRRPEFDPLLPDSDPANSLTVSAQFFTTLDPGHAVMHLVDPGPSSEAPRKAPDHGPQGPSRFQIEREA